MQNRQLNEIADIIFRRVDAKPEDDEEEEDALAGLATQVPLQHPQQSKLCADLEALSTQTMSYQPQRPQVLSGIRELNFAQVLCDCKVPMIERKDNYGTYYLTCANRGTERLNCARTAVLPADEDF
eukprot:CAMPEP_0184661734 /NCGR_PEP_ID=MMETSP0308-20130426/39845_1 /TAXON_ID=38269 /ORGANISM="Gloeochaete witrockiana, Strain SAG 46.84" /LENGTH=125 /DNA_ID=CAMNT_0027103245 /DNA_START=417 /DNA_END=794 /DNA_ORIENTATION=-